MKSSRSTKLMAARPRNGRCRGFTERTNQHNKASTPDRPVRHELVANAREFFEAGRLSEVGYLRPFKKHLVNIFVSKQTLGYARDMAHELFQVFEDRGYRVMLAS